MKIREYLDMMKTTLATMAENIGVHEDYLWRVSTGRCNPSYRLAKKISSWSDGKIKIYEIRHCTRTCDDGCACSLKK